MKIHHFINGKIVSHESASISVFDLGLLRSYGVFDYAQIYEGKPFHLLDHIIRLGKSAEKVGLEIPYSPDELLEIAFTLLEKNPSIDAGLRFIVTGGYSENTLLPTGKSSLIILFHPTKAYPEEVYKHGMKAITTKMLRFMPDVKSTNYMPAIFGLKEAQKKGFDDALYLDEKENILEGTTCNAFFFKNGTLITDDSNQIVKGVTRDIVLKLAKAHYPIELRPLNMNELKECDEAFLTSSIKDLVPLVQINDPSIGDGSPGKKTSHLRSLFHTYIDHYFFKGNHHVHRNSNRLERIF